MVTATRPVARSLAQTAAPALYDAVVTHERRGDIRHRFTHRTFYWLVDIDVSPRLHGLGRILLRHDRGDHLDVRPLLAAGGIFPERILMLAHPRTLGRAFNPLSTYWCYDAQGERIAVVAEVHNTYGDKHAYLLRPDDGGRAVAAKAQYVSPFYPVDGHYDITVSEPEDRVSVSIALHRDKATAFLASLTATRRPLTNREVLRMTLRYPLVSARTAALIRFHGIRLWLRGLRVQPR